MTRRLPMARSAAGPREHCGLYGAVGTDRAVSQCYYGLFAQQHRGQESAGIAALHGERIRSHTGMGLVAEAFQKGDLAALGAGSRLAIGHVRYSTAGMSDLVNAQPLVAHCARGSIAVGHNGNLTNSAALRSELEQAGSIFQGSADSEVILHLYARPPKVEVPVEEHLLSVLRRLEGAFSLLFLLPGAVVAARDRHGWRPLWLGRLPDGGHVFASESCAFALCGAEPIRELEPGEVVFAREDRLESFRIGPPTPAQCIFEHVYFARPDSTVFGDAVYEVRKRLGRRLAEEHPADADVVIAIPDSGTPAAVGYAEAAGLPLELGFVRSHYVGRTFINPSSALRDEGVSLKLAVVPSVIAGRRVVVIDDSIVRGTTARSRVRLLFDSGAKEVHFRVSCPPIRHPCFFGVDFPTPEELIANKLEAGEPEAQRPSPAGRGAGSEGADRALADAIGRAVGATSMGYLSLEGLLDAVSGARDGYCTACFSGRYPIEVPAGMGRCCGVGEGGAR